MVLLWLRDESEQVDGTVDREEDSEEDPKDEGLLSTGQEIELYRTIATRRIFP
jgi:hypothetical protein